MASRDALAAAAQAAELAHEEVETEGVTPATGSLPCEITVLLEAASEGVSSCYVSNTIWVRFWLRKSYVSNTKNYIPTPVFLRPIVGMR